MDPVSGGGDAMKRQSFGSVDLDLDSMDPLMGGGSSKRPRTQSRDELMELDAFLGAIPTDPVSAFSIVDNGGYNNFSVGATASGRAGGDFFDVGGSTNNSNIVENNVKYLASSSSSSFNTDYLTMTTPDHCLVMAQRLEDMARKNDCCDLELVLAPSVNDMATKPEAKGRGGGGGPGKKRKGISMHMAYACAASPVLRAVLTGGAQPTPKQLRAQLMEQAKPIKREPSSTVNNGLKKVRSPASAGETDACESSTCSSKGSGFDDESRAHTKVPKARILYISSSRGMKRTTVELALPFVDVETLQVVRTYIYTGVLHFLPSYGIPLLRCALFLEMQALVNLTLGFLQSNIDIHNALKILAISMHHNLSVLKETALEFACSNFDAIVAMASWRQADSGTVEALLQCDSIRTEAEVNVFRALSRWAMANQGARQEVFVKLALNSVVIRLAHMTREELIEMSQDKLVEGSKALVRALYDEAMQRVNQQPNSQNAPRPRLYGAGFAPPGFTPQAQNEPLVARRCEKTIHGHGQAVCALAVMGNYLITASGDHKIRVYDTTTWVCERILEGHESSIVGIKVTDDKLMSASSDRTIRVWSVRNWSCIAVLHNNKFATCSLTTIGDMLITGSDDGCLKSWSMSTWSLQRTIPAHQHVIWALACYEEDILISGSSDTRIKVWSVQRGNISLVRTLHVHKDEVQALAVDNDNNWLVSGSDDGTISIHDCKTWNCLRNLEWQGRAILSLVTYDRHIIAGLGSGTVNIWNGDELIHNNAAPLELKEHTSCVMALAIVRGKLVSASFDRSVKIWGP